MATQENALATTQDNPLAHLGLAEEIIDRCTSLGLRTDEIVSLAQLPSMYGCEATEIIEYVEAGLTLNSVAESLRLRHDHRVIAKSPVPVVCEALAQVGFNATDSLGAFETSKELHHGRAMTSREMEAEMIDAAINPSKSKTEATPTLFQEKHEIIIEALAEAGAAIFKDPIEGTLKKISDDLGGDVLYAFAIMNEAPGQFDAFLRGQIDALTLRASSSPQFQEALDRTALDLPDTGDVDDDDLDLDLDDEDDDEDEDDSDGSLEDDDDEEED